MLPGERLFGPCDFSATTTLLHLLRLSPMPFTVPLTDKYSSGIPDPYTFCLTSNLEFFSFFFSFWGYYTLKVSQTSYFRGPAIIFALKADEAGKATFLSAFGSPGLSNSHGHTSARDVRGCWKLVLEL